MDALSQRTKVFQVLKFNVQFWILSVVALVSILLVASYYFFSAPRTFPGENVFVIESGQTVSEIGDSLKTKGYIRSALLFKVTVGGIFLGSSKVIAGDYVFDKPISTYSIADRVVNGRFNLKPTKVTIPEGLNKFETAELIKDYIPAFDSDVFVTVASEGYLFPDTYFFNPNVSAKKAVEIMQDNFRNQIKTHQKTISESGKSLNDIITMASIVETEARHFETRQTIAGILWKRIAEGMPLQVDVTFKYINGKSTFDLTLDDLKHESRYNLYRYTGLPPTPIANPGLDSIVATLTPKETSYYYFLSDETGKMHYASVFSEHIKNKQTYLR